MVYILNLKDPASFLIQLIFSLYQGSIWGHSDPEADDTPMCHQASLIARNSVTFLKLYVLNFFQGQGESERVLQLGLLLFPCNCFNILT